MTETQAIQTVIDLALSEVGYHEKASPYNLDSKTANAGSGNYTKYGKEMHSIQPYNMDYPAPYCDCFVDWLFYRCFGRDLAKQMLCGDFDDYTVNSAQLYKNAGRWVTVPKKGYQIFFRNESGICHTGIVYKVSGGTVYTVEGNSSDQVAKRSYDMGNSRIAGYGMPKYALASGVPAMPVPTSQGRVGTCTVVLGEYIQGCVDGEIKSIQRLLNGKGYKGKDGKKLTVDGELGENTAYAIEQLQRKAGLKNINYGTVSSRTWGLLLE